MPEHKRVISEDDSILKLDTKKIKTPPNPWNRFYPASVDTQKAILVSNNTDGTTTYHQIKKIGASVLSNAKGTVLEGNFHSTHSPELNNFEPPIASTPDNLSQNSRVKSVFSFFSSIFKGWIFEKLLSKRYFATKSLKQSSCTPTKTSSRRDFKTPGGHTTVYTPNGTAYNTKRYVDITVEGQGTGTLVFLSPSQSKRARTEEDQKTKQELNITKRLCFDDESTDEPTIKGGKEIKVQLHTRDRKKAKTQLAVMKLPAKEAMATFLETHKDKLPLNVYTLLKETIQKSRMTEWCHGAGFGLCPTSYDPQVKENLGAGFPWINTFMMVLEQVASYFVKRYPDAVYITPTFYMIPKTDVIAKIKYCVTIHAKGKTLSASNEIVAIMEQNRTTWPTVWDTDYIIQTIEEILADQLACGGNQTEGTTKKAKP